MLIHGSREWGELSELRGQAAFKVVVAKHPARCERWSGKWISESYDFSSGIFGGHGTRGVQYIRGGGSRAGHESERGGGFANATRAAAAHPLAADASRKARGDTGVKLTTLEAW